MHVKDDSVVPRFRLSRKGVERGEYVKKYAPEYCEVFVVYDGKKGKDEKPENGGESKSKAASNKRPQVVAKNSERHFFECVCFSSKFD